MTPEPAHTSSTEHTVHEVENKQVGRPKTGETYRCPQCGMELHVTSDCHCERDCDVRLECCGQELIRA